MYKENLMLNVCAWKIAPHKQPICDNLTVIKKSTVILLFVFCLFLFVCLFLFLDLKRKLIN